MGQPTSIKDAQSQLPDILAGKSPVTEALLRELAQEYKGYDLTKLDTSQVTDMSDMFNKATNFNQPIGDWDVSNATNMKAMFDGAVVFNNDGKALAFNTSKVALMSWMFAGAEKFNQALDLDTSRVNSMWRMFHLAKSFNQPLNFDVSSVVDIGEIFDGAKRFNQDISSLNIRRDCDMKDGYRDYPIKEEFKALPGRYEQRMTELSKESMRDMLINISSRVDDPASMSL